MREETEAWRDITALEAEAALVPVTVAAEDSAEETSELREAISDCRLELREEAPETAEESALEACEAREVIAMVIVVPALLVVD